MREMRRGKQVLSMEDCKSILCEENTGILALVLEDSSPYTVPINFVYDEQYIYMHCANEGLKLDAIKQNKKVSFCVIAMDQVIEEEYTTHYKSVNVFGDASVVMDQEEKWNSLYKFTTKYVHEYEDKIKQRLAKSFESVTMIRIDINTITGKMSKNFISKK